MCIMTVQCGVLQFPLYSPFRPEHCPLATFEHHRQLELGALVTYMSGCYGGTGKGFQHVPQTLGDIWDQRPGSGPLKEFTLLHTNHHQAISVVSNQVSPPSPLLKVYTVTIPATVFTHYHL